MNVVIFTTTDEIHGFGRNYGAYLIASSLRQAGFSAIVIDFFKILNMSEINDIIDKYIDKDTIWAGFSSSFFTKKPDRRGSVKPYNFPYSEENMLSIINRIRNKNENIKILYGGIYGAHAWYNKNQFIDFYVFGFAEEHIIKITKALQGGLSKIWNNKKITCPPVENYNIPMIWTKDDHLFKNECLPIEFSRGCLNSCPFCNYRSKNKKSKSFDVFRQEFIYNYENFGTTDYMFMDATLTKNYKLFQMLVSVIKSLPFKIEFSCFGNLPFFIKHPDTRETFQEIGCRTVKFGIESLNEKTLKFINKGPNPDVQIKALNELHELWGDQIKMTSGFIVGLPYDNERDIMNRIEWLENGPLHEFILHKLSIPTDPGFKNDFARNPERWGYELTDKGWISKTSDMTSEKALNLVNTFYNNRKFIKSTISYSFPFRLKNLGFTNTFDMNIKGKEFDDEMKKRRLKYKNEYVSKLLT